MNYYLAIDIGASSGRHILGHKDENNQLIVEEIYRFKNFVRDVNSHLTWDITYLLNEVKQGIKIALQKQANITSMSIDTWGVDYVLMQDDKEILPCYAYRDTRCSSIIDEVHSLLPFETLYSITGTQFQPFNTIYQLYYDLKNNRLKNATDFLMIPEYLIYKLTGKKVKEYTNASTMGLLDAETNSYSKKIIQVLNFPPKLFSKLKKPSFNVGDFTPSIQEELQGNIPVVLCATHDTGSAVEGIAMKENAPYISSGTWSLLGLKVDKAITSTQAMKANYSNEYGPNYIRFQKNIMGLWIIQCLAKEFELDFPTMVEMAKTSHYKEIYDVNEECFLSSMHMKDTIINYLKCKNKPFPTSNADIICSTFHSLAYSYKTALNELEEITHHTFDCLYIVGGGAKNQFLNELCHIYTNKEIIALPIEATAIGNLKIQMEKKNVR